ncbi:MAG: 1-deoxy-D-xylulose-5-phosphate reductoisomerase [Oscillospiraceae bacterium]|jgi:1-deoxy-D-xylulose-5-phosphate reductoisomerase|nr:1-deoxy-D-xylulose-5-phosphate reductoisomerase [Oscillospiraceae bacterium]
MKKITILGSTGSIGTQALEVCRKHSFDVIAMTAGNNIELFCKQVEEFKPRTIFANNREVLKEQFPHIQIMYPEEIACIKTDIVLNALAGEHSELTIKAAKSGNNIALANKEALVYNGEKVMKAVRENKVRILPVDSEHSAIFQALQCGKAVRKIFLTASGGPFFGYTKKQLEDVTLEDVLKHPTWKMGKKVTVDSSTLMNKGFEFVEAMYLFDLDPSQIEIVIHPESIVHSAVEFADGSVIAQMSSPDMRLPIQYALAYPRRLESDVKPLSLIDLGKLTFFKPDFNTFTPLKCMLRAVETRKIPQIAALNDSLVEQFLKKEIRYIDIFNELEEKFG